MKQYIVVLLGLFSLRSYAAEQFATGGGIAPMKPEAVQSAMAIKVEPAPKGRIGVAVQPKVTTQQVLPSQVGATGGGIAPMTPAAVQATATGPSATTVPAKIPLYFVTGNAKKLQEVTDIFKNTPYEIIQLNIDLIEIQETDGRAVIKAKFEQAFKEPAVQEMFAKNGRGAIIIDDTSLYFDALLGQLPGPLIKWFDHSIGNQGEYAICKCANNFNARATTWIGYATSPDEIKYYEGTIHGTIVEPREKGYGWDPIFKPVGFNETFAGMTPEQKNAVSMRGVATRKMLNDLVKGSPALETKTPIAAVI
ncbi:MAG TPA: non-canonical purine NTP pyrophosphatase [Candidatus Babeliales bacterium]|nr:non-canonical purine NTP pyrophosphatase [Candidatus Babeliales bacterium]